MTRELARAPGRRPWPWLAGAGSLAVATFLWLSLDRVSFGMHAPSAGLAPLVSVAAWSALAVLLLAVGALAGAYTALHGQRTNAIALRERERHFRALFEGSPVAGLLHEGSTGRVVHANLAALELYGHETVARFGTGLDEPRVYGDVPPTELVRSVALDGPRHVEVRTARADGSELWQDIVLAPLAVDGQPHVLVLAQDVTHQKRAQRALAESESRLETVIDNLSEGLVIADARGNVLRCNRRATEMHGVDEREELSSRFDRRALTNEWRRADGTPVPADEWPLARVCRGETVQREVLRFRPAFGAGERVLAYSGAPLVGPDGTRLAFVSIQDITASFLAERALREEKDRLALVAATVPSVIISFREAPDGKVSFPYTSPRIVEIYGLTPEEMRDSPERALACWHPDELAEIEATVGRSRRELSPWHMEFRIKHPTRGEIWIEGRSMPVRDPDGGVTWHGSLVDITDRKRTERRNAAQATVSRALATGCSLASVAPTILETIGACEGWSLGMLWTVLEGREPERVGTWRAPSAPSDRMAQCAETASARDGLRCLHRALLTGHIEVDPPPSCEKLSASCANCLAAIAFPILEDGQVVGVIHFLAPDVPAVDDGLRRLLGTAGSMIGMFAERRNAEAKVRALNAELEHRVVERTAQYEAANRELEAFSYSVSHDLRTPLRAIDGFSQAVLEDCGAALPAEGQQYLGIIRRETQRMGQLIDDLLAFSRLGRTPLSRQDVDMTRLVRAVIAELSPLFSGRSIEITVEDLAPCVGDPALLTQVWTNLLSNAFKYTSRCAQAVVHVGQVRGPAGQYCYFVRDNGAGFDMKYAHKLFGVFQRLHRVDEYSGTGVGLSIVQRIVHRHGGKIWAEAAEDRGATFTFSLDQGP